MHPNQQQGMIRPTLYLGLGGTGKEILLRLRRRLYERFGRGSLPFTSFVWADLDIRDVGARGEDLNEVLKKVRFEPHERIELLKGNVGKEFGDVLRDQIQFRYIHQWLYPEVQRYGSAVADGAGGIRAIGRLAWFKQHSDGIGSRIPAALQAISTLKARNETQAIFETRGLQAPQFDQTPQVFVVCSVAGGTGGGTLVDTLFYLKRLQETGTAIGDIFPIILLPNVYYQNPLQDWRSKRSYANAYAALKELEHYTVRVLEGTAQSADYIVEWQANSPLTISGPPFSAAYLVEMQNEAGVAIPAEDRRELFDAVAASLFLDLMPSGFSAAKRGSYSNVVGFMAQAAANPIPVGESGVLRQEFARRYASFGTARIEVPVEALARACAAKLAQEIGTYIQRVHATDWLAEARRDMAATGLDRAGLDKRLGSVWRDSIDREVARVFGRSIQNEESLHELEKSVAKASEDLLDTRRGSIPAALKAAVATAKDQLNQDIENWIERSLDDDERGPRSLTVEQGLLDRFEEEWSRLDAGLDGRESQLATEGKDADRDADNWRQRCDQLAQELRAAIASLGLSAFAARNAALMKIREQYRDGQQQYWLARAEKHRIEALGEFLATARAKLRLWRSRIKVFISQTEPWAVRFDSMQRELLTFPEQALSIRLYNQGDLQIYYRLDNQAINSNHELTAYLQAVHPQKPSVGDLIGLVEGRGADSAADELYRWTEERFHRDVEINPRGIDLFSYPQLQGQRQARETADRLIKAALPMLRHSGMVGNQAAQNVREAYLGVPKPDEPHCRSFCEIVRSQLLALNYPEPEVFAADDSSQIFLYIVDYGFAMPLVNLAVNECHEAYSAFYLERITNRLQGQTENQIPLHLSQQWEGHLRDLRAFSGAEAQKIATVYRLMLFGVMLNVLDREKARFSNNYRYFRGAPHWKHKELGNFRDTVQLLCKDDDLYQRIYQAVDSRERGLDQDGKRALFFACQYLIQTDKYGVSTPEHTQVEQKLVELAQDLDQSNNHGLRPVGTSAQERAAYCLATAGDSIEVRDEMPILAKLEQYPFPDK